MLSVDGPGMSHRLAKRTPDWWQSGLIAVLAMGALLAYRNLTWETLLAREPPGLKVRLPAVTEIPHALALGTEQYVKGLDFDGDGKTNWTDVGVVCSEAGRARAGGTRRVVDRLMGPWGAPP